MTELEQAELVETWLIIKMKAFQPSLGHLPALTMKICPKCRKRHAGVDEELAGQLEQEHEQDHERRSSHSSLTGPVTPVITGSGGLEV